MKVIVSKTLKGELILSSIKKKFKPGVVVDLPDELASHEDVLWAKKKGYISFDSADEGVSSKTSEDEIEFLNVKGGGIMVAFLKRTLAPNQRFILKKSDPNMETAMKLVSVGYLSCSSPLASVSSDAASEHECVNKDKQPQSEKKVTRKSFRTKKSKAAIVDDSIFGMMNTEIG
jgi:hypothetical protein